jgi:hypothetical protein
MEDLEDLQTFNFKVLHSYVVKHTSLLLAIDRQSRDRLKVSVFRLLGTFKFQVSSNMKTPESGSYTNRKFRGDKVGP